MGVSKIYIGLASATFALSLASPAFAASEIKNAADCEFEGGTMTNVKGSDYCIVPIRPEEYKGEEYDGNQLGVVDCPGDKLNDGVFCAYPVTVREEEATPVPEATEPAEEAAAEGGKSATEMVMDAAKDKLKETAEEEAKKKASNLLQGN